MVFHIGEAYNPKDLHFFLGDGTRIENPFDCRTDEERTFRSMLAHFKIVLRTVRNARLPDLGLPPNGPMRLRTFDAPDVAYVGAGDTPGPNADVLVDFGDLTAALPEPSDFVYTASVFDRAWTSWMLAVELGKVLKPGGTASVQWAGAWPVVAGERDFWRVSKHARGRSSPPRPASRSCKSNRPGGHASFLSRPRPCTGNSNTTIITPCPAASCSALDRHRRATRQRE